MKCKQSRSHSTLGLPAVTTALPQDQKGLEVEMSKNSLSCYTTSDAIKGNEALCTSDHQMGLGRKAHVSRDTIPQQGAHQSVTAGPSSETVVEMVQFSFWCLLAQFLLLFTSRIFWNHLSNGNIHLVLFQGEITLMMVERHCLGLGSQRCLSCHSLI